MTRKEVLVKAIEGRITWIAAADILGVTPRHMRRLCRVYEATGYDGLVDHRRGKSRRKRIPLTTIRRLCELRRRALYSDLSIQHFARDVVHVGAVATTTSTALMNKCAVGAHCDR